MLTSLSSREWPIVAFVPDYSGGSTVDLHHLPFSPSLRRAPAIVIYSLVNTTGPSTDDVLAYHGAFDRQEFFLKDQRFDTHPTMDTMADGPHGFRLGAPETIEDYSRADLS